MKGLFAQIDRILKKIPPHILDLIQKIGLALSILLGLFAIVVAIQKGLDDARPAGLQLADDVKDLFYIERLQEENLRKRRLLENIEVPEKAPFPSTGADFLKMAPDSKPNFIDESKIMIKDFRRKSLPLVDETGFLSPKESLLLEGDDLLKTNPQKSPELRTPVPFGEKADGRKNSPDLNQAVSGKSKNSAVRPSKSLPFLE